MATPATPRDSEPDRQRVEPARPGRPGDRIDADRIRQMAPAAVGIVLLVRGLRQRSLRGILTALAGGWLLSRSVGGPAEVAQRIRSRAAVVVPTDEGDEPGAEPAIRRSVTVGRPPGEVYEAWRDPDVLSRVVGPVAEVTPAGEDRYRWTLDGPFGREVAWETRIVETEPGALIRWETPAPAVVPSRGSIRFRPARGDRGTTVTLEMTVDPPGGELGRAVLERLDTVPETAVGRALGRFKSLVETGEIPTLDANPSARGRGDRV